MSILQDSSFEDYSKWVPLSKAPELTAHSRWCAPELILPKLQCQTGLAHAGASQKYHLNPEGLHWSAQSVNVELGSFWHTWECFLHQRFTQLQKKPENAGDLDPILWSVVPPLQQLQIMRFLCCQSLRMRQLQLFFLCEETKSKTKVQSWLVKGRRIHFLTTEP